MKKKILSLLVVFAMVFSMVPMASAEGETTNDISAAGDGSVTYTLIDGTLSIEGTGAMTDFTPADGDNPAPWADRAGEITAIELGEGLTAIGDHAFSNTSITSITFPTSVTRVGSVAFSGTKLTSLTVPETITEFGAYAFERCANLVSLTHKSAASYIGLYNACSALTAENVSLENVERIYPMMFANCSAMRSSTSVLMLPTSVTRIDSGAFTLGPCRVYLPFNGSTPGYGYEESYGGLWASSDSAYHILICGSRGLANVASSWESDGRPINGTIVSTQITNLESVGSLTVPASIYSLINPTLTQWAYVGETTGAGANKWYVRVKTVEGSWAELTETNSFGDLTGSLRLAAIADATDTNYVIHKYDMTDKTDLGPVATTYDSESGMYTASVTSFGIYGLDSYTPLQVTFDPQNGSSTWQQDAVPGLPIVPTAEPSREGFTFAGWMLEGEPFDVETTPITQDITLTAAWVEESAEPAYTLAYEWAEITEAPEGATIPTLPAAPTDDTEYESEEAARAAVIDIANMETSAKAVADVNGEGTWHLTAWDDGTLNSETNVITYVGTWEYEATPIPAEPVPFTVVYAWTGAPEGDDAPTAPTDANTYHINLETSEVVEEIAVDSTFTAESTIETDAGTYTFSGWDTENPVFSETEPYTMTFNGSWTFVENVEPGVTPDETAATELTGATFELTENAGSTDENKAEMRAIYDAENSVYFTIEAVGATDEQIEAFNDNTASLLTVTLPFDDVENLHLYTLARWDEDAGAWVTDGLTITGHTSNSVTFTTNHLSTYSLMLTELPAADNYFMRVFPTTDLGDAQPTHATITDDEGNAAYSMKVGETFDVVVYSSTDAINLYFNIMYDTSVLTLTGTDFLGNNVNWQSDAVADAAATGTSVLMEHYKARLMTEAAAGALKAGDPIMKLSFRVIAPTDGSSIIDRQAPIKFYGTTTNPLRVSVGTVGSHAMNALNTLVVLAQDPARVLEVSQYGDSSYLVLVYSQDVGTYTITDAALFDSADSATLANVTNAGYIYRNDKASTDTEEGLQTAADFYSRFDSALGQEPAVYGIVVNQGRLLAAYEAANGEAANPDDYYKLERFLLGDTVLSFVAGVDTAPTALVYNPYGWVYEGTSADPDDESAVQAIRNIDGGLKDATVTNEWETHYNDLLAHHMDAALRCDFVRTVTPTTNEDDVKAVEDPEYQVVSAF